MSRQKKPPITREELYEKEQLPRTRGQIVLDCLTCFIPLLCGALALTEYFFIPNVKPNDRPFIYAYFIVILMSVYLVFLLIGLTDKRKLEKVRNQAPVIGAAFLILALYDILTLKSGKLPLPFFPWVNQILIALVDDRQLLLESSLSSLRLLFTGYILGAAAGLVTGIACGYNKKIHYWVAPIIKLLGPIPSTTWIPIIMVICTSLFRGSVFIIGLGVWFSVTIASITGIDGVSKSYLDAARILGAKGSQLAFLVAIPGALPSIFQGLVQGMSSACTALMVAEMIGAKAGLGWYITWQKSWAVYSRMYAAIALICVIFTVVTAALNKVKKTTLRWQEGVTK